MLKYNKLFYWIESPGHFEDWFVVAPDQYLAEKFFADKEGFDLQDLNSTQVCETIFEENLEESYFPSFEILKKNGFEFISEVEPMVVWKSGRKYCQGDIVQEIVIQPNVLKKGMYIINVRNSDLFKIGITKNIVQRMKQFETANPYEFYLHEFFPTENCRRLESELHKLCKGKKYKNEWFKLTEDEIREISNYARKFIGLPPYIDQANFLLNNIDLGNINIDNTLTDDEILPF
ncbi:hypothetical protein BH11BAC3_BH11BAC3_45280 [soil metagenome]